MKTILKLLETQRQARTESRHFLSFRGLKTWLRPCSSKITIFELEKPMRVFGPTPLAFVVFSLSVLFFSLPGLGKVDWRQVPISEHGEFGTKATARATLDVPLAEVVKILRDLKAYDTWMPSVADVRDIVETAAFLTQEGTSKRQGQVSAHFVHTTELFPDFPCDVIATFTETENGFEIFVHFVECVFDRQSIRMRAKENGEQTDLDLEWIGDYDGWLFPDPAVALVFRSSLESTVDALDARAHELVAKRQALKH